MESFNYTGVEHIVKGVAKDVLPLFYLVPPSQSSFATLEEIPKYVVKVRARVLCVLLSNVFFYRLLVIFSYTVDHTLFFVSHLCGRDHSRTERTSQDSCERWSCVHDGRFDDDHS